MNRKKILILGAVVIYILLSIINRFYLDWLWFVNLDYGSVFTTILFGRLGISSLFFLIFFGFLWLNFRLARSSVINLPNLTLRHYLVINRLGNLLTAKYYNLITMGISALTALLFTSTPGNNWLTVFKYLNRLPFGTADPILSRDAGFYVFELPFYLLLKDYFLMLVTLTAVIMAFLYFAISSSPGLTFNNWWELFEGKKHLSLLVALIFIIKAVDYRLKIYELLFSPRGAAFGAGYTDVNVQIPAFNILIFISLILAVFLLFKSFKPDSRTLPLAILISFAASLVLGAAYPAFIQKFRVEPNELAWEMPYLEHNIAFTRKAYDLDNIEKKIYPVSDLLTFETIEENQGTIQNIRLLDPRPLIKTYNQLQGLRPYYKFNDIDIDRYNLNGTYRQVMLAARELDQRVLPAKTWVNQRLKYTHGYGVTMSPVNEVTRQGLPYFIVRDIPPITETDLVIEQPGIYYGELTDEHVIVNTKTEEFDYSLGDTNAYTQYEGEGGVTINSFFRKVLFAMRFNDYRMLLSNDLTNESRVMFDRNIHQRAVKIAPFLEYDGDPYIVINDGRLFWIQDAYTTTNRYPYSEPYGNLNYIRNSVKVVIDAYHGKVNYYVIDDEDPLVMVYRNIFPELFKSINEMPEGLNKHLRYPEGLFNLQSRVYSLYHMEDVRVFYNKEDAWQIPTEKYEGQRQQVEPYYSILQLPGEKEQEFVLMLPYSPITRDNMIAWLAARSDGDNYGKKVVYLFPKDKTIFGPQQVEGRIDQNAEISSQLSLWDQRGSSVLRGNLLVLPINNSILYVEPVFLQAEQSQLPELIRVIVVHGQRVVMEENLQKALVRLFGEGSELPLVPDDPDSIRTVEELVKEANELINKAKLSLKEGNWAEYGRYQEQLESTLKSLAEKVEVDIGDINGLEELMEEQEGEQNGEAEREG
ncbi:MAG: UPF0182 family protein [Firmicutes bacterium HGW-Firmicutes-13]|nr:MAG: UPF0182 family protein [Firmicutes bacterium HGW-Firmicutes-13]